MLIFKEAGIRGSGDVRRLIWEGEANHVQADGRRRFLPRLAGWSLRGIVCWLIVCTTSGVRGDETAHLDALCAAFESARSSGDVEAAKTLMVRDAKWVTEPLGKVSSILGDIEAVAKRKGQDQASDIESFVAERSVEIHDHAAVVTELLRVTAKSPEPPLRRSMFWVRQADGWKLAHVHTSTYLRWDADIRAFESSDATEPPEPGGVVFVGSSSIRRWGTLASDFPGVKVLNRGFGGSQMVDSVLFAKRIVTPYLPSAVVVYEGDNDIGNGKSAEQVFADFQNLVASIHGEVPDATIGFLAIKPSLKRWSSWMEIQRANKMVAEMAAEHPRVDYLDIATPMLGADGKPREELFASDGLHLNDRGYAVWRDVVGPWLATLDIEGSDGNE